MIFRPILEDTCGPPVKFPSSSPICHISANTFPQLPTPSIVTIAVNHTFAVNRWNVPTTAAVTGGASYGDAAAEPGQPALALMTVDPIVGASLNTEKNIDP